MITSKIHKNFFLKNFSLFICIRNMCSTCFHTRLGQVYMWVIQKGTLLRISCPGQVNLIFKEFFFKKGKLLFKVLAHVGL